MTTTHGHRQQCLALLGLAAAAALLALVQGPAVLRVPLGFLAVLVLPGYALTLALMPSRDEVSWAARLGLAIALSIGLLTLAVLALDRTPWRLASGSLVVSVTAITVVSSLVAWWTGRPVGVSAAANGAGRVGMSLSAGPLLSPLTRRSLVLLGLVTLLVTSMLAFVTSRAPTTTELFVLGARGDAESYPRTLRVGEPAEVELGITNREGTAQTYRVELSGDGIAPVLLDGVMVPSGETHQQRVQLRATAPGVDRTVSIKLYRPGLPEPYRQLQLVVDVDGPA
ncbi:MAG: DUF1616 domain-containing protein [Chloroflexota bacterium]